MKFLHDGRLFSRGSNGEPSTSFNRTAPRTAVYQNLAESPGWHLITMSRLSRMAGTPPSDSLPTCSSVQPSPLLVMLNTSPPAYTSTNSQQPPSSLMQTAISRFPINTVSALTSTPLDSNSIPPNQLSSDSDQVAQSRSKSLFAPRKGRLRSAGVPPALPSDIRTDAGSWRLPLTEITTLR